LSLMEERVQHKLNKDKPAHEHTQVRLADFFDVMAGTSTGGIIVSALNTPVASHDNQPRTSKEVLSFYTEHAAEIFPAHDVVARARSYIWSQYSQDPLAALLKETFGDEAWLSDCLTDMIIPTYDMRGGLPYTFRTS